MEASAIFAVSHVRGVQSGLLVAVSDELFDSWRPGFQNDDYLNSLIQGVDAALEAAGQLAEREANESDRCTDRSVCEQ